MHAEDKEGRPAIHRAANDIAAARRLRHVRVYGWPAVRRPTASELVLTVAAAVGDSVAMDHEVSFWLRSQIDERVRRGAADALPSCGHLRIGEPIVLALWTDLACCVPCTVVVEAIGDMDQCDRCEVVVDRPLHICTLATDRFLVVFGLCPSCRDLEIGPGR